MISSDGNWDCDELVVENYNVGDTSFRATFLFRPVTHSLGQVFITHAFEFVSENNDQRLTKEQIYRLYAKWRDLLAYKYGEERGDGVLGLPPCSSHDWAWGDFELCAKWQGLPGKSWDDSQGTVLLDVDGSKAPADQTYFNWLSVTYNMVDENAAGRL